MNMNVIDWLRLWVLNRIVQQQVDLGRLVLHPEEEVGPYWDFPKAVEVESQSLDRLRSILEANAAGELTLFQKASGTHGEFRELRHARKNSLRMGAGLLNILAVITREGHNRWESEFCPDWRRVWEFREISEDNEGITTYDISCSSDDMLREILDGFAAYIGADRQFGLRIIETRTVFGAKASFWKVLQTSKRIRVQLKSYTKRVNDLLRKHAGRPIGDDLVDLLSPQERESGSLARLSRKW